MILYFIAILMLLSPFQPQEAQGSSDVSSVQEIKTILPPEQLTKLVQEGIKLAQPPLDASIPEGSPIPQNTDSSVLSEQDLIEIMQTLLSKSTLKRVARTKEDYQNQLYTGIAILAELISKKSTQASTENILKNKILEKLFVMGFKMLQEADRSQDGILDTALISKYFKWEPDKPLPMTIEELTRALKGRKNPATAKCPVKDFGTFLVKGDPTNNFKKAARLCDPWKLKDAISAYAQFKSSSIFKDAEAMEKYVVSQYYLRVLQRLNKDLANSVFQTEKKLQAKQKKKLMAQYKQQMEILEAESVRKQQMISLFSPGKIDEIKRRETSEQNPAKKAEYQNLIALYDAQADRSAAQISGQPVLFSAPFVDAPCQKALLGNFSKMNKDNPAKCLINITQSIMENRRKWKTHCRVLKNFQEIQIIELLHKIQICSNKQE